MTARKQWLVSSVFACEDDKCGGSKDVEDAAVQRAMSP